ncbi:MAG: hypothetical protein N5P05_002152 [Chroococcopsis gigantea SAG 12.99]|jgi:uncharacterized membrane protein SpoIIM required for sporulation|nr:stage II sporulation protein M [Chlorogloea purpurea SAG 13.99]MDV3000546.1 hypothetical protein [Chroococcopsis gigantea SAG 12.99]
MNIQRWLARREQDWKRLDQLLTLTQKKGVKSLQSGQICELASLYRSVSGDLARAQTQKAGDSIVRDLQQLTSRGYSLIYQGQRKQEWLAVKKFFLWGLPQALRENWLYIAVATLITFLSGSIAWWYSWHDPAFMELIVPQDLIHKVRDEHQLWMGSILGSEPIASSSIMQNNIRVAFNAIAGGIIGGIGTVIVLVYNGLLLGAIAALVGQNGLAFPFWAFVFPHGALELPAIFIAGGAGLLIGKALLLPGIYRRVDAIKYYGNRAAKLVFGIVPLLIVAGIIEGFISPNPAIPDPLKYLLGTLIFTGLCLYINNKSPVSNS